MRFNKNKPKENTKRVEGKVISKGSINANIRGSRRIDIFAVTIERKKLGVIPWRETYSTDDDGIATLCDAFLYEGMMCYLTVIGTELIGCGAL